MNVHLFNVLLWLLAVSTAEDPSWIQRDHRCPTSVCCEDMGTLVKCNVTARRQCQDTKNLSSDRILTIACQQPSCTGIDLNGLHSDIGTFRVDNCRVVYSPWDTPLNLHARIRNRRFAGKKLMIGFYANMDPDPSFLKRRPFLRTVAITRANLTSVPTSFLWSTSQLLHRLDLSNNHLKIISAKEFYAMIQMGNIGELILDHNRINDFGQEIVYDYIKHAKDGYLKMVTDFLHRMKIVSRSTQNKLRRILATWMGLGSETRDPSLESMLRDKHFHNIHILGEKFRVLFFYSRQELQLLSLNHNQLTRIPDSIFGLNQLKELQLAYNKIAAKGFTKTKQYVFRMMTKLRVLNMEGNLITTLEEDALVYLPTLHKLNIARNRISFLPGHVFRMQSQLLDLDVSNNLLTAFTLAMPLKAMRVLNINGNRISYIGKAMMRNFPSLQILDASNNPLEAIGEGAFSDLRFLRKVRIQGHRLTRTTAASFRMSPRPSFADRVSLSLFDQKRKQLESRLTCDCDTVFLATAHEHDNINVLTKFQYPRIEPVHNKQSKVCVNIFGQSVNFEEAMTPSGKSDICAMVDFDCPRHCACCKSAAKSCNCVFICPPTCHCYRSRTWKNVTVSCKHTALDHLPSVFSDSRKPTDEQPYVTDMTITDANIMFIDEISIQGSHTCPKGLLNLKHLTIRNCHLHKLLGHPFRCMPQLRTLNIVRNPLEFLPSALFSSSNRHLYQVNLSSNGLKKIPGNTFSGLSDLTSLDLSDNPFTCDCSWEAEFFHFAISEHNKGLMLRLPKSCIISDKLRKFGGHPVDQTRLKFSSEVILPACERLRATEAKLLKQKRLLIMIISPVIAIAAITTILGLLYCRHRYSIWLRINDVVEWQLGRRVLGLQVQQKKRIDVALFFHENQAHEQSQVSNFIHALGKDLEVQLVTYYMPGAFVNDQLASLLTEVAMCFVYITTDFLNDSKYTGPIRDFLENVYNDSTVCLVPIYPNDSSIDEHEEFSKIRPILRRYNGLVWGCSYFWERLELSLPPRRQRAEAAEPIMMSGRNKRLADLCVVAHENQLQQVKTLFERYGAALSMVHYRNGALFNCAASEAPKNLLQVLLWSRQVILVLSPSLVQDEAEMAAICRILHLRLSRLAFRGSLVVLDVGVNPVAFNGPEREAWPTLVREHSSAISRLHVSDVSQQDWTEMDEVVGVPDPRIEGVSAERFHELFQRGGLPINSGENDMEQFELNRLEWDQGSDDDGLVFHDTDPLV